MNRYLDSPITNKRKLKRKIKKIKKKKQIRGFGFKLLCYIIEIHALLCISASYILAFMDKISTNETLSAGIVAEIIAPVVVWGFKGMIENIFEHNKFLFSEPIDTNEDAHSSNMEG